MSGILNNKSRIIDAMLTSEGRRQMAESTFEISYVTFTDLGVGYIPDAVNGHDDPTNKIYFEACNLPQDQITFEANDEGKLVAFRSQDIKVDTGSNASVPNSVSEAQLINGKLNVYQRYHGRVIKTSDVIQNRDDDNCGFIYSDTSNVTASILINSSLAAGTYSVTTPSPGGPFVAYVGTKSGLGSEKFAQVISGAIESLRQLSGGPNVVSTVKSNTVYLDNDQSFLGAKIFTTGSLSFPLTILEGALGGNLLMGEVETAAFASQMQGVLTSSIDNFNELQTISSVNRLFEDDKFSLTTNEITFDLSKASNKILNALKNAPPSLNSIDSLFNDDKLSHLENFMYLPPIIKTSDSRVPDKTNLENIKPYLLGDYPSWGDNEKILSYSKLIQQISEYEDIKNPIYFEQTSNANKVIGQFFEVTNDTVRKLDVVDFGFIKDENANDSSTKKVFFVGKTFLDNRGTTCFVNMFTLIFSRDERRMTTNEVNQ
jgi:hypothetical protein